MITNIFAWFVFFIIKIISGGGYLGITVLMLLESACLPIPSEIIMPFSGYLVTTGRFSLLLIIIFGAVGNLVGSIIAYGAGSYGGRPFIEKYGRYVFLRKDDLDKAQRFFEKYGNVSIFFSRLLPVIRTFISLPAGIARMRFGKFCFYTFIGSLFWSAILSYIGLFLGKNWESVGVYFRKFDWLIGILLIFCVCYFIYKKIRKNKKI
jgi:membrane protein DedA with SNARE-associated domain